jgi:hypothetical protein
MVALRVYADLLEQPSIEMLGQPYEVAVIDADEHKTEILALCRNVIVAKAAFVAAVEQRAGKRVKLTRSAQVHADSGDSRYCRGVSAISALVFRLLRIQEEVAPGHAAA